MKTFTTSLLSLFLFAGISSAQQETFTQRFQASFSQSIKGLEAQKGAASGNGWESKIAFPEFSNTHILTNETLGVLALRLSSEVMDEEAGKDLMPRMEAMVNGALPAGDYIKSQTYGGDNYVGYMKTVYEFNSSKMADKQKRPAVEIGIIKTGDKMEVVVLLIEPFFKNQYEPRF